MYVMLNGVTSHTAAVWLVSKLATRSLPMASRPTVRPVQAVSAMAL